MAKMNSGFTFLGTIGNISAYKMRGNDSIILRTKGGASRQQVKNDSEFENTRRVNMEFGGRSTAAKRIKDMMKPIVNQTDLNLISSVNKLLGPIQTMDTTGEWGRRSINLSGNPRLLSGFSFNKKSLFDSVVRSTVNYQLNRTLLNATVDIPALLPGINFFVPWSYPLFGFQVALGVVPDMFYDSTRNKYIAPPGYDDFKPQVTETSWFAVEGGMPDTSLTLNFPSPPPDQSFILLLSIGIRYGKPGASGQVEQIPYAGSGRILSAV